MPKQNRVTPFGRIIATPEYGTFLGNRGVLHDAEGRIRREWQLKRWIVCLLKFRGRRRTVMTPGRYTELFFLDEATALAAGHRPCAECRRARFLDFCNAWNTSRRPTAPEIDDRLHAERVSSDGSRRTFLADLEQLPNGVFILREDQAHLVHGDSLLTWAPAGYRERRPRPSGAAVRVLTPPSTVRAILAGYVPEVHASALTPLPETGGRHSPCGG
jgi:hypothetical protein